MTRIPICPKCGVGVSAVTVTPVEGRVPDPTQRLATLVFTCPACGVVLGVTADPIAVKAETIAELLAALRRK